MPKEIPIYQTEDPLTLQAMEAYGERGQRQLRVVSITNSPEHEGMAYMDIRDVQWLVAEYNALLMKWKFWNFGNAVETVAFLEATLHNSVSSISYA